VAVAAGVYFFGGFYNVAANFGIGILAACGHAAMGYDRAFSRQREIAG
jgi:hypothetical protein